MTRNLGELLLAACAAYGDDVAFQMRRGFRLDRVTYREAGNHVRRLAAWLACKGLAPGDRIAVWAPNMPEYPLLIFGAWLAGVVVVPVDVRTRQEVVERFVQAAGPRLGFASRYMPGSFGPSVAETFALEDLFELIKDTSPAAALPTVGTDDLCQIAFTSGTTGAPKGVMITHGNYVAETEAMHVAFPLDRGDRALSVLPLSHALEQTIGLLLPFTCGVRVSYVPRLNAAAITRTLRADAITCMILVPELLRLILTGIERRARQEGRWRQWQAAHRIAGRLPFPLRRLLFRTVHQTLGGHLRFFGCGGAPLDVRVATAWERMGIRVFEGYGLTETSAAATINNRKAQRLGTVGRPVPGVAIRIAADGEILVRGPTVTPGYYDNPELTARSFADGWLLTGDAGAFDPDGFLRVIGREAFKIVLPDGRNVYVEDVEAALHKHPLVRESCVVPVIGERGETVHAVLLTDTPSRAAQIVRETNRDLAAHQQIAGYTVWTESDFPRTATLKVDRKVVRSAVEHRQPAIPGLQSPPGAVAADQLAAVVVRIAGRPPDVVRDAAELGADLGLDSIGRVELLSVIEEELGRVIDEVRIGPRTTVAELRRLADAGSAAAAPAGPARWPRSWWARIIRRGLQWAAFRLQDRWMRIEVVHPERLATNPLPSILIYNYQGPYAPAAILRALPVRLREQTAIAADDRLWHGRARWQGLLLALAAQAFPFAKQGAVRGSLDAMGRLLDCGQAVIISPEGDPEEGGRPLPFLSGTGLMAVEMQVPVVPFRLEDYHRLFAPDPPFPYLPNRKGRVRLIVGEPVTLPRGMSYDEATGRLEQALFGTA